MKSHKTNVGRRSMRWKWMAGATAASAAGVTASQATTINLVNNFISATAGNHLNADLTGDGHPDLTITGAHYRLFSTVLGTPSYHVTRFAVSAGVNLNGVSAYAFISNDFGRSILQLGSQYHNSGYVNPLMGTIPIFFKDLHINGGAPTRGSLEVTVFNSFAPQAQIQLDRFTYNSTSSVLPTPPRSVPDQGSSLALLAMGAGGVLALRRWRAAEGRS